MASREKNQATQHQPLLSSLVVRPTDSVGGGGGSDYEPGEVRRDPPSYSRSDQSPDNHGSASPVHLQIADRHYSPEFDRSGGPPRSRGFGRGREPPRDREQSPPYGRGRDGGRFIGKGMGPGLGPGTFRGDGMPRNNPNVCPREGDWMCSDPRQESCNNCNRSRYGPRRGYAGLPPPLSRRFSGPPVDRSPGRNINGYRSPPCSWARNGPRELGLGGPAHCRREGRFSDHQIRRDRHDYLEDNFRERSRLDRRMPLDWGRDRGRGNILNDRKGYERRPPSPPLPPPLPPHRGHRTHDVRERSRSPVRDLPPPKTTAGISTWKGTKMIGLLLGSDPVGH